MQNNARPTIGEQVDWIMQGFADEAGRIAQLRKLQNAAMTDLRIINNAIQELAELRDSLP